MAKKFLFEELDEASREYLTNVRIREGQGFAGVYVGHKDWLPLVGLIVGLLVMAVTAWFTIPPLGDPWKTTMLQVAGFMLGGWMAAAALRVWAAAGSGHYLGHFVFADALHLWEAAGPSLTVTNLEGLTLARGVDNYNEGAYLNTIVTLEFDQREHAVTIGNLQKASDLIAFFNILASLRNADGGAQLAPGALGQTALGLIGLAPYEEPYPPRDSSDEIPVATLADHAEESHHVTPAAPHPPARGLANPDQYPTPPTPRIAAQGRSGWIAYLVIVILAVGGLFLLYRANLVWHDHAWFNHVKDQDPPELRAYLLDPLNTRHRDEVNMMLADFYDPIIERVKKEGGHPRLGPEFLALVDGLKTALQPLVSLKVKEESRNPTGEESARMEDAERKLTEALHNAFTYNRKMDFRHVPGNKLIDAVKPPEKAKPILEVVFRFQPVDQFDTYELVWTIRLRSKVSKDEVETMTWTVGRWTREQFQFAVQEGIRQTMKALTGKAHWNP